MNQNMLIGMAGKILAKLGTGLVKIFLILPSTLTNYFSSGRFVPAATMYPSIVASIVLPPAIIVKGISAGFDFDWFLWAGANGLIFGTFLQWVGNQLFQNGLRWVPGLGAARQRMGISFSVTAFIQRFGAVGKWLARVLAPAQSGKATYVPAKAAGDNETLLRGTGIVESQLLARHIKNMYAPDVHHLLIDLGGVPVPYADETKHWLLAGRTGSGKTQAYNRFLQAARLRGNLSMIADAGGGFLSRFGRPGDFILNPFDDRDAG